MDYTAFIDMNSLTEEAKKELESFYTYLIFKYKKKMFKKKKADKKNFEDFLASSIQSDNFMFLDREERNER